MSEDLVARPAPAAGDPHTPGPTAGSVTTAIPPRCPTRTRLYRAGKLLDEGFPAEQLSERLAADPEAVAWLDLYEPTEDDLRIVVDEFGLHPLAVEDAVHPHQRAKVDRYPTHLFASMYAVAVAPDGTVVTSEISMFIADRALVTVRKDDFDVDGLITRWDQGTGLVDGDNQLGALVHGVLDSIVDGHAEAIEHLDDSVDDVQADLFQTRTSVETRRRAYELGTDLSALRRIVAPMPEVVGRLMRDSHLTDDTLDPYFQDVHDHTLRTAEAVESARDRVDRIVNTQLNEQGAQLNEITKKLAAWAAIIAVPTAVTGFYGQNVPYPGYGRVTGFVASCVVVVTLAGLIYWYLRRNKWL